MSVPYDSSDIFPQRIFLDTGVFQAIYECGGCIFDDDPIPKIDEFIPSKAPQILKRTDGREILECLRAIFTFDERSHFDWIVAASSLDEIDAMSDFFRSRYARDIKDHSDICLSENPPTENAKLMIDFISGPSSGSISRKDKKLLLDAATAECDHFLTIEKKLPTQSEVILKFIPMVICSPCQLWSKLEPHLNGL